MSSTKRVVTLALTGILVLGGVTLPGCSSQGAAQRQPQDFGYTQDVSVDGISLKVSPDWECSDLGSMGTVFSDAKLDEDSAVLGGTTALFVKGFPAGTADDIDDVEEATGWDMPVGDRFGPPESWEDDIATYSLSTYASDYGQTYFVLIGNAEEADFSIFARTEDEDDAEGIGALLRGVVFDPEGISFVDKSGLEAALVANDFAQEDFEPEGWDAFVEAREKAERVLEDEGATQEEVDSADYSLCWTADQLVPLPSSGQYIKFDYDWYMENYNHRDGEYVAGAFRVTHTFQSGGRRYLVSTLANEDATLSDHDVLLIPSAKEDLSGYQVGDALPVFGTTHEMQQVTLQDGYDEALPAIDVLYILS